MNKLSLRLQAMVAVFGVVGLLAFPLAGTAATITFDADTTIQLPNNVLLTIVDGGLAESIVINDTSLSITTASDTDLTIRSSNKNQFITSGDATFTDSCESSYSQLVITVGTGAATVTVTPNPDAACGQPVGGGATGGGGGGGGGGTIKPTNTSVVINGGAETTSGTAVTLTLAATSADEMLISNESSFLTGSWVPFATSKAWTLSGGEGTKTVYAKFRKTSGGMSDAVSDTIIVGAAPLPTTASGAVTKASGGTVGLSDDSVAVQVPANALSADGTVAIAPTASYTAPTGGLGVVGSRAFDLSVTVGVNAVTSFTAPLALTFTYTDAQIVGFTESTLGLYYWDTTTSSWKSVAATLNASTNTITASVDHFTVFAILGQQTAQSGELVALACAPGAGISDPCKAVYYLGANGKRYVFPNQKTYATWYSDFSQVKTVSSTALSAYMIGGNVTYRPGVKLVKIQTDPKVYAVGKNGALRWVATEALATQLYGTSWARQVEDIPVAFFINYTIGSDIAVSTDFSIADAQLGSANINADKSL